jgi:hypothetical protein
MAAHLHLATRDHIMATWECVVILIWRAETTSAGIRYAQDVFDALALKYPQGVFLLNVVEPDAPMPVPEVRSGMAAFLTKGGSRMTLSAVVHEGQGFRAAAVRSLVTGLALITKLPYRHKIFSNVAEAVAWFSVTSPVARAWGPNALVAVVSELRARVDKTATH